MMAANIPVGARPSLASVSASPTNRNNHVHPFDLHRLPKSNFQSLHFQRPRRRSFGSLLDDRYQAASHDIPFPFTHINHRDRKPSLQSRVVCSTLPAEFSPRQPFVQIFGQDNTDSTIVAAESDDMAAVEDRHALNTAPSSPPELSFRDSNSSNSSFRTDSMDDESSDDKMTHFEEVGLEEPQDNDDFEECNVKPESRPTLRRPSPRSHSSRHEDVQLARLPTDPRSSSSNITTDALNRSRSGTASVTTLIGRSAHSPLPSPGYASTITYGRFPSRSPSPNTISFFSPRHVSTASLTSLTPQQTWDRHSSAGSSPGISRRSSWQPNRKTVAQLEAEYDDEDEDVPDEAILENVPITPLPGMSLVLPRRTTPSPQRRMPNPHLQGAHGSLHSAKVPRHAKRPAGPPLMTGGQYGASRSPRHGRPPMLPHSVTAPVVASDPLSFKHRSASWSKDLNEEARQLSAALEEYTETHPGEKRDSAMSIRSKSSATSPPRPSLPKAQSTTALLDLPPVQKGNIMIDPLPISKEKEAVLTRTRPSWLPPKDQKEERRHIKEWEQMMARAKSAEKKRASRQREELESSEETKTNLARIWEQHVLPNWAESIAEPKTRELWWRGVTPSARSLVWQKAVGNELELTNASYEAALKRADVAEEKIAGLPPEERSRSKEAAWFDAIARDIPNVLPSYAVFQADATLKTSLTNILRAYTMYRSDVGYVFGTHLIAAILCIHLRSPEAFVVLANLMNRPMPLAFLVHDTRGMTRAYELVLNTLKYKIPHLHAHLTAVATNIQPDEYLDPIFRCLLAHNLPPQHVSRLWDIYIFEGDKTLVRAAVAILSKLEPILYGSRDEILDLLSWRNEKTWDVGSEDDFISLVREAGKADGKNAPVLTC